MKKIFCLFAALPTLKVQGYVQCWQKTVTAEFHRPGVGESPRLWPYGTNAVAWLDDGAYPTPLLPVHSGHSGNTVISPFYYTAQTDAITDWANTLVYAEKNGNSR